MSNMFLFKVLICSLFFLPHIVLGQNTSWSSSQNQLKKLKNEKVKSTQFFQTVNHQNTHFEHGISLKGELSTQGWGLKTNYYLNKNNSKNHLFSFSFAEIKHEKEISQKNNSNLIHSNKKNRNSYIFGKINNVYILNFGLGKEVVLFPLVFSSQNEVKITYQGGLSVCLLKPYYLKILDPSSFNNETLKFNSVKYDETLDNYFLDPFYILESDKWIKGVNETKLVPGLFADISAQLGSSNNNKIIKGASTGINCSIFPKRIPIMALQKSYFFQIQCYISFELGWRW